MGLELIPGVQNIVKPETFKTLTILSAMYALQRLKVGSNINYIGCRNKDRILV